MEKEEGPIDLLALPQVKRLLLTRRGDILPVVLREAEDLRDDEAVLVLHARRVVGQSDGGSGGVVGHALLRARRLQEQPACMKSPR